MGRPPRSDIDAAIPGVKNSNSQRCGRPKTKQSNPVAGFDTGYAKAAESDDARAKQRGRVQVVKARGQGIGEVRSRNGILSVTPIYAVAGECRSVAEVFKTPPAVR